MLFYLIKEVQFQSCIDDSLLAEEATSLKVLLSNASYNAIPEASKSDETSFNATQMEPSLEGEGEDEGYYCGECTMNETV